MKVLHCWVINFFYAKRHEQDNCLFWQPIRRFSLGVAMVTIFWIHMECLICLHIEWIQICFHYCKLKKNMFVLSATQKLSPKLAENSHFKYIYINEMPTGLLSKFSWKDFDLVINYQENEEYSHLSWLLSIDFWKFQLMLDY